MKTKLYSVGLSDVGAIRENNEDAWAALPEIGFFALADGMGGHNAGEIAAQETVDFLVDKAQKIQHKDVMDLIHEIRHAIEQASQHIYKIGSQSEACQGMGTTLCCLLWTPETIVYAHVGDSRIYRFRDQKLTLLTQDHSLLSKWLATGRLAAQCETPFPYKHVITRSVGGAGKANPEIAVSSFQENDIFFLCSDGLTDVLSLKEMEDIFNNSPSLESVAKILIEKAKFKGSSDNMTIVIIQEASKKTAPFPCKEFI